MDINHYLKKLHSEIGHLPGAYRAGDKALLGNNLITVSQTSGTQIEYAEKSKVYRVQQNQLRYPAPEHWSSNQYQLFAQQLGQIVGKLELNAFRINDYVTTTIASSHVTQPIEKVAPGLALRVKRIWLPITRVSYPANLTLWSSFQKNLVIQLIGHYTLWLESNRNAKINLKLITENSTLS